MLMQTHEARLAALREELKKRDLDGFVVPISDEHMSEYIGSYAQRLAWLTGFGGSAGAAIVLRDHAAMFVDGRYTIQVRDQVDGKLYDYCQIPQESMGKWLLANAPEGAKIGYDAWLHTRGWVEATSNAVAKKGITLVATEGNPVDSVWQDRPEPSKAQAVVHRDEYAGRSSAEKRSEVADWLKSEGYDAAVISALDSIAWLLNIRGNDVDRTPVALSYVIAHADGTAELFIASEKVTPELEKHLGNAVTIRERTEFEPALAQMKDKTVSIDPDFGVEAIFQALETAGAKPVSERDPVIVPKAVKNEAEQQGHRDAQARDGAALAKFLYWLATEAPKGGETELSAVAALRAFREETGLLKDQSFDTISAAGPHAAIPHYRVDEESNLPIAPGSIFLCDSGGQYLDGTTDITRTVWIGTEDGSAEPTPEHKDRFTRVLKGHIALAMARFPDGTSGGQLDALARQFLWQAGVDYAHGTGHGVGSYLGVHEGPQRIAKATGPQPGTGEPLRAGMILSNEPGYYKGGDYGIRIENLVLTVAQDIPGAEGDYLGFDTLTFVPIDRTLVDTDLLTAEEIGWWNRYHAKTLEILAPQLSGDVLAFVEDACRPL
ncbi:aminopeptidase P family protein [Erythrobacter sp. HKB08]|uniref:aminopeptidase P family protein n=1 Tax=Erythrobacter sp. HKB08 TaxID=2502843 RepID=UPI001008E822|nr:aminopeptidase P family protein [Erythrobacter sp. HKB08]